MGEAKRRGSFAWRKAQAIEAADKKRAAENAARYERLKQYRERRAEQTPEQRKAERKTRNGYAVLQSIIHSRAGIGVMR